MHVYDLTTQTLKQCRLDPTDATNRSDNQFWITTALNEAYRKICRDKLHPWTTEAVTLDSSKCFLTSALSKRFVKIVEITKYQHYSSSASYAKSSVYSWDLYDNDGTIVVPYAEASGTVYVTYEYLPTMLGITYNIKGANTVKVIPVDEAITDAEALALVGETLNVVDVSTGLRYAYTVASAAAGAAGAATITTSESISVATADGDEIYIGEEWEPTINADWHMILTYWATMKHYLSKGASGADMSQFWLSMYNDESAYITPSIGERQQLKNAYRPL